MCWDHIDDEGNSIRGVLVNKNGPGEFSVTSTGATICDKTRNRHEAAAKIQEGQEDHVYNKLQENMNKKLLKRAMGWSDDGNESGTSTSQASEDNDAGGNMTSDEFSDELKPAAVVEKASAKQDNVAKPAAKAV